ncbi:lipopolysaccharide heptosyltransferase family protein [Leptospira levettii]|uniref:Lipopolysaccharide heptosyltransferase family protein n=2 Tax=Leptospira levettii TaxID=2023178 RepID=A0ABY2MRL2_9LEPT|nr:glycosyltransferase family 9 protein [Leptospira levettii]MCW7512242.1 glycosyltransferase family 9 protein [Leptospira levettii]TGL73589.1 lipopolysaccharide heptosyltransferase family protein [Leptospira levettii]TGM33397.1 lipopolysaccharide heptosyltransferase family protein [Leptospira levettii]TGM65588.1 lipopolysaccharide heptosyltransferase family protein [Leptospira levettii]TGM78923.1 lipopolysaccharide heptosyltransferase family protein [Leptospira levettii]
MIKSILIFLASSFRLFSVFKEEVTLICKIDNIGDYILFRNFLKDFRNTEFNHNRKIVLVGNVAWKDIFESHDFSTVDKVIWINLNSLQNNIFYRYGILFLLNTLRIHTIVQPTFSRNLLIDFLLLPLKAKFKFTPFGDDLNHIRELKVKNDLSYSHIFKSEKEIEFEFDRNLFFFQNLDPVFSKVKFSLPFEHNLHSENVVSFFIGSSSKTRQFSMENLSFIVKSLENLGNYRVNLLGGQAEFLIGEELSKNSERVINLCGKLKLTETINAIGNSKIVLTMDSSGLHMAMGTGVPNVYCFSNGNHAFRFVPYPKRYTNLTVFFPPIIEMTIGKHPKIVYDAFKNGSLIPIDSIRVDLAVKKILKGIRSK